MTSAPRFNARFLVLAPVYIDLLHTTLVVSGEISEARRELLRVPDDRAPPDARVRFHVTNQLACSGAHDACGDACAAG